MAENTPVSRLLVGNTTEQLQSLHGKERQLVIDTAKNTAVVMDGVTLGGHPLAKERTKIKSGSDSLKINDGIEADLANDITLTVETDPVYIGGLYNTVEWVTVSGEWTASHDGWHEVLIINGGDAGGFAAMFAIGGAAGARETFLIWLTAGQVVPVIIGAGGVGQGNTGSPSYFGSYTPNPSTRVLGQINSNISTSAYDIGAVGGGPGNGHWNWNPSTDPSGNNVNAIWYGGGGGARKSTTLSMQKIGNGFQGAIRIRSYDPTKTNG